jgi:hypothetical protein
MRRNAPLDPQRFAQDQPIEPNPEGLAAAQSTDRRNDAGAGLLRRIFRRHRMPENRKSDAVGLRPDDRDQRFERAVVSDTRCLDRPLVPFPRLHPGHSSEQRRQLPRSVGGNHDSTR